MTLRTRAELNSDADTHLEDNTTGNITPADVRQRVKDLADSALLAEDVGASVQGHSSVLDATTASFTTADETKLDNIEATADVTDAGNVGSSIHGASAKTTPVDADTLPLIDSAASNVLKKVTWANIKATLKTYFDGLYATVSHTHTVSALSDASANARSFLQAANYAAMKALLSLVKADVGLGNVDNTSDATKNSASATLTNKTLGNPVIDGTVTEDVYTISDGAGFAINPRNGSIQQITLGANRTPTVSGWVDGDSVTLLIADGTAFAITWSTIGVVWKGGTAPTLATSGYTEVNITRQGSVYRGVHVGDFAS